MQLEKQTVYIPVKVEDELPNKNGNYLVIKNNGWVGGDTFYKPDNFGIDTRKEYYEEMTKFNEPILKTTHWLKEKQGYFLTEEEISELIFKACIFGGDNALGETNKTIEQYIDNLLKQ